MMSKLQEKPPVRKKETLSIFKKWKFFTFLFLSVISLSSGSSQIREINNYKSVRIWILTGNLSNDQCIIWFLHFQYQLRIKKLKYCFFLKFFVSIWQNIKDPNPITEHSEKVPLLLLLRMHPHQKTALAWMVKQELKEMHGMRGGILADVSLFFCFTKII